jgi:RNA polymerase primary sigma factor
MRQLKITKQITSRDDVSFSKYLNEISPISGITADEEVELSKLIQENDQEALNKMVKANLRFVISVAKQYHIKSLSLSDLVSAGNEGLIIAAKRFDPSKGFKFISYAVWWIRQSILKYINENGKQIRMPLNKIADLNKIKNATSVLEQIHERSPSLEEIAEYLSETQGGKNYSMNEISFILSASTTPASLDMPVNEDSTTYLVDLIRSDIIRDSDADLIDEDLKNVINKMLDIKLTPKEKQILVEFFGLNGVAPKSLDEIGISLELTRERVRQIKEKALRKLKYNTKTKEIKEYL